MAIVKGLKVPNCCEECRFKEYSSCTIFCKLKRCDVPLGQKPRTKPSWCPIEEERPIDKEGEK